jgi:hypothetical protein
MTSISVMRRDYYSGNESGPKLHIEYTEAAGGYAHSQCIII